jgi:hypothetical protein
MASTPSLICLLTLSSYVQGRDAWLICQVARTNERGKSLELQTTPDLHIGGVIRGFYENWINRY